jgi:hypothetical protein
LFRRSRRLFFLGPFTFAPRLVRRFTDQVAAAGLASVLAFVAALVMLVFLALTLAWYAFAVFVWNAVLVPMISGAVLITSLGGAFLFFVGLSCFGRVVGFLALLGALLLFLGGGTIDWLNMTMGAGPLAAYGLYCLIFAGGLFWDRD